MSVLNLTTIVATSDLKRHVLIHLNIQVSKSLIALAAGLF